MVKTRLYIARHGKTMFNTLGRAQGWSDTPLTEAGERGIRELGLGLKEAGLSFEEAVSSDSGRTIQTMGIILQELGLTGKIPYRYDKRIREWCFGSFDGAYGGELFHGVVPRVLDVEDYKTLTLEDLANGICQVDTANWAEPWEVLKNRILEGFEAIAKEVEENGWQLRMYKNVGGKNRLVKTIVHDEKNPKGFNEWIRSLLPFEHLFVFGGSYYSWEK